MTEMDGSARVDDGPDLGDVLVVAEEPKKPAASYPSWDQVVQFIPSGSAAALAVRLIRFYLEDRRSARLPPDATMIGVLDARLLLQQEQLAFPEGGPTVGVVYARHPLRRRHYVPFAQFHRVILQEKWFEAARYLLSLGARDIEITWEQTTGKASQGQVRAPLPNADEVSLGMGFALDASGKHTIRITGAGKKRPRVPGLVSAGPRPDVQTCAGRGQRRR